MSSAGAPPASPPVHLHGPGRASTSLAAMMQRQGWPLLSLSGGSEGGAEVARAALGGRIPWSPGLPPTLPSGCLLVLGVPDDRLAGVARELAGGPLPARALALHLSGLHGREVLEPLATRGLRTAAFHPLRAFPAKGTDADLGGCLVAVEVAPGAHEDRVLLVALARSLGGEPFELEGSDRALYHLGAVVMSNALLGLMDFAQQALTEAGVKPELARRALLPLARTTLDNAERLDVVEALTGPVVRGDVASLSRHLEALDRCLPGRRSLYVELIRSLLSLTERRIGATGAVAVRAWLRENER